MTRFAKHMPGPVNSSDPWSDDVLKRNKLAEDLTTALATITQPFVLGLHAEFGNGKTFFIQRWRQHLENAGDVAVYFNAWETDYVQEPLIAFTAAIKQQLEAHGLGADKEAGKALAASAGRIFLKAGLPRAISLATGGLVQASDIAALKAIGDEISGAAAEITDRAIDEAVKHHEEARDEVERFRSILADCAIAITKRETGDVCKLIVFVDELDRCRPDYAVHVLECIKHFFSVENVLFVIAIDRDALNASISAVYGDGINVDGYLRKFFDYHIELGPPNHEAFALLLAQSLRLEEAIPHLDKWITFFSKWCRAISLPLRVQEQMLLQANFILRSYDTRNTTVMYYLVILSLLIRTKDVSLFDRIAVGQYGLKDMRAELERLVDPDDENDGFERIFWLGVKILLAGFGASQVIQVEYQELEGRLKARDFEVSPAIELDLDWQMQTLEWVIKHTREHPRGRSLGRDVIQRIRFLAT
jgi:hypothetical protein